MKITYVSFILSNPIGSGKSVPNFFKQLTQNDKCGMVFQSIRHMGGFALQHLGPWSIEIQNLCFVYDPLGPHFGAYTRAVFSHSPSKWLWMKNQNQFQYITTELKNTEKNQNNCLLTTGSLSVLPCKPKVL